MRKLKSKMKSFSLVKTILARVIFFSIFIVILVLVISYARGYRPDFTTGKITPTGILATSSSPKAAKVYINGVLKGVTDLNLTLPPGEYTIEMKKEGYTDWKKTIILKGELVMSVDGLLFPRNPSLSPITSLGIVKAIPVDHTDRLILISTNDDLEKDGIYTFELNKNPLSLLPPLKPLILKKNLPPNINLENISVLFSHDYRKGIFEFTTAEKTTVSYLLSLDEENIQPFDITNSKEALLTAWREDKNKEIMRILETFPKKITRIATDSFRIVAFSPDETKLLYQAKKPISLPAVIVPPLIASSQAPEERTLQFGNLYVYDRKEDKNFPVKEFAVDTKLTPTPAQKISMVSPTPGVPESYIEIADVPQILWYPDSRHFIVSEEKEFIVIDYDDGGNRRTVYSGPFIENFFTVTNEGKLLIITNLNPQYNKSPDLYEVGIR